MNPEPILITNGHFFSEQPDDLLIYFSIEDIEGDEEDDRKDDLFSVTLMPAFLSILFIPLDYSV